MIHGNVLSIYVDVQGIGGTGADPHLRGEWSISATCGGQTYGPILMTLSGTPYVP